VHYKELKRTTNTGRLAIQSLMNSEMRVRGERDTPEVLELTDLLNPNYRTLFLFPSKEALELDRSFVESSTLPIQLLVPDGNWRQASKVTSRHSELAGIPRVKISKANLSQNHLRVEHFAEGMSTLEAVAQALGVIEGPEVMESLMRLYRAKLERTLLGRQGKVGTVEI